MHVALAYMASTPIGAENVFPIRPGDNRPSEPAKAEDPRFTSALRWVNTFTSGVILLIVASIASTMVGMRDNQITMKAMMDSIIQSDKKQDDTINRLRNDVMNLQIIVRAMELRR